jgi:hypothetical protein
VAAAGGSFSLAEAGGERQSNSVENYTERGGETGPARAELGKIKKRCAAVAAAAAGVNKFGVAARVRTER